MPAIAALSVQRASGGMNNSTPFGVGHRGESLAERGVGGDAAADPEPLQPGSLEGLAALGDEHVDDGFLKARGQVGDLIGRRGRAGLAGVLAAEGVEDGGLQAGEAEVEAVVVEEGAGEGEGFRVACRGRLRSISGPPG